MPADPKDATTKPEQKPNEMKDLPQRDADADAADKIKGGITGPCANPKRRN